MHWSLILSSCPAGEELNGCISNGIAAKEEYCCRSNDPNIHYYDTSPIGTCLKYFFKESESKWLEHFFMWTVNTTEVKDGLIPNAMTKGSHALVTCRMDRSFRKDIFSDLKGLSLGVRPSNTVEKLHKGCSFWLSAIYGFIVCLWNSRDMKGVLESNSHSRRGWLALIANVAITFPSRKVCLGYAKWGNWPYANHRRLRLSVWRRGCVFIKTWVIRSCT